MSFFRVLFHVLAIEKKSDGFRTVCYNINILLPQRKFGAVPISREARTDSRRSANLRVHKVGQSFGPLSEDPIPLSLHSSDGGKPHLRHIVYHRP